MIDNYSNYAIELKSNKTSGEVQCLCPKCSHTRKKKTDKCLSVNLDKRAWSCHHCGWKGYLKVDKMENIVYTIPKFKNNTQLSNKLIEWFNQRKIGQKTLLSMKVGEGKEWMPKHNCEINTIQFNYWRGDELINTKYRTGDKVFKFEKGAELCFYNENALENNETIYFVEGEMDCLSFVEAGINGCLSVPNGANLKNNPLPFLDGIIDKLAGKNIVLAFDNDVAGRKLRDDFADRLDKSLCKYIEFKDCKDANECLVKYGINGILEAIANTKEFPLEGTFTISDYENEIDDMYLNGLDKGVNLQIDNFKLNIVKGYLTVITGIPSHGKSDWLDFMCIKLKLHHDWKGAFYSPENRPIQLHISKLARKIVGKGWDGVNRINMAELNAVKKFLDKDFWFIKPEKDFTLTSILNQIRQLQLRYGLDFFVIDAWNKLEHIGKEDSNYIGKALDEIVLFAEKYNLHCFLVAHPTKIKKDTTGKYEIPNLYDIAGSANFYNKADNGISVYRDFTENTTTIFRQKIKFDHWGEEGNSIYKYDLPSKRYYIDAPDNTNWINKGETIKIELQPNKDFENEQQNTAWFAPTNDNCPF